MKKKLYNQPIVELTQLMPSAIVLAGSPKGVTVDPSAPIPTGEGGD